MNPAVLSPTERFSFIHPFNMRSQRLCARQFWALTPIKLPHPSPSLALENEDIQKEDAGTLHLKMLSSQKKAIILSFP